ncbi:hypothetical protein [Neobacillus cucumis]|uniref:hypothetical protein n=1 Tax=Neobacillus cucumis TaxID=1740721 RepID=UPI0015E06FE7|nr:hypothetical protein [Neobacillus cucumis]
MRRGVKELSLEAVIYRGFECKVIFDYKNGNLEILVGDEVILVSEDQIEKLVLK